MKRIEEMSVSGSASYFPEVFRGLTVTGYRFWRNLTFTLCKNSAWQRMFKPR